MAAVPVSDRRERTIDANFEQIYREHAPMVYRTARAILGNAEDAEDVLQTIFLRLLRRTLPPDLTKSPKAYLYRAAVNSSLDKIESRRRHVLTNEAEQFSVSAPSIGMSPEEDLHQRLYEAIAKLGPEAAQILVLRYVHDISDAEIAKMFGTSRTTIAVRLFRLRARLKKLLRHPTGGKV